MENALNSQVFSDKNSENFDKKSENLFANEKTFSEKQLAKYDAIHQHLVNDVIAIIYLPFLRITNGDVKMATFLSYIFYWTKVVHKTQPYRNGWIYKTAKDWEAIGFSRREVERCRNFFMALGVIQYQRKGTHGRMHFNLNIDRLIELLGEQKVFQSINDLVDSQIDRDNTQVPKWLPLEAWNEFLAHVKTTKNRKFSNKDKSSLIAELNKLRKKFDLRKVIRRSIEKGWTRFYNLPSVGAPNEAAPISEEAKQAANVVAKQLEAEQNRKQKQTEQAKKEAVNVGDLLSMLAKRSTQFQMNLNPKG